MYFIRKGNNGLKILQLITMKLLEKFVQLILLSSLIITATACRRTVQTYYPSGKMESSLTYRGKKMDGLAEWFYQNGSLKQRMTYKRDKLEGSLIRLFINGDKEAEETYHDGLKNGPSRLWGSNNTLIEEKFFHNDTLHGTFKQWYASGIPQVEGNYNHGLYAGRWFYYDEMGLLVGKGDFTKGNGLLTGFDSYGRRTREVPFKNNERNGDEKWYASDGKVVKVLTYQNGKLLQSNTDK